MIFPKAIGKLPKPKGGCTLPGHKYTGPYNDIDSQIKFNLLIMINQQVQLMLLQCSMMLIIVSVVMTENVKIELIEKWSNL